MTSTTAAPSKPRNRVSITRLLVLLISVGLVGWFGSRIIISAAVPPATPGPSSFSPYVDVTAWPTFALESPDGPAQSNVTLAFIVADHDEPCTPSWGGYYTLERAGTEIELDRRLQQLRDVGGDARVSFGGAINNELATVCTNQNSLLDAYRSVVDRYEVNSIDLDIEGAALNDTEANERRATAIAALQAEVAERGETLTVWLTLPVGPNGLTEAGEYTVRQTIAGGVDVAGVNGMTMDFNIVTTLADPQSRTILLATNALHAQVKDIFADARMPLSDGEAWGKVGMTVMIGQNDIVSERFTFADAETVNQFARDHGVGFVSMWSLNRDATCTDPLPSVMTVVQDTCSGIDQQGNSFADALSADLPDAPVISLPTVTPTAPVVQNVAPRDIVDDPAKSPYPIWDSAGTYDAGTKIVWRQKVYEAKWWTSGFAPDTAAPAGDSPWTLLGPVLPGDTPAPLPTLPTGTYPEWDVNAVYVAGERVLIDNVPYEAKWWTQGNEPGTPVAGGSPWVLVTVSN